MKKLLVTLLATSVLIQNVCYAESIKVSQKPGSSVVEGTVEFDGPGYETDMTIAVYDKDSKLNYYDVVQLDKDGKASFSYYNLGDDGDYNFIFSVPALNKKKNVTLTGFVGDAHWEKIADDMSKAADVDAVKTIITTEKDNLALDMTDFNALANQDEVYTYMYNDIPTDGFADVEAVEKAFYSAVAFAQLKEGGAIADFYADADIDMNGFMPKSENANDISVLDSLSSTTKTAVLNDVNAKVNTLNGATQAKETFRDTTLFTGIAKAESWADVRKLLNAYSDAGLLNVDKDMNENVYKALVGKSYTTYAQIETDVATAKAAIGGSTSGSGSSGGGGGGSSSGGVIKAPAASTVTPIEKKDDVQGPQSTFTDMEDAKWALNAVENLYKNNIISGVGDGKFAPHNKVKREEMAKMLVDLTGIGKGEGQIPFTDVDANSWSYPYICAAYANAVVSGVGENEFGLGMEITREQAAVLVYRALQKANVEMPGTNFKFDDDSSISDWAKDAVYGLYSIGAISGRSSTEFAPKDTMTRVEAAVLLNGVLKYFGGGNA